MPFSFVNPWLWLGALAVVAPLWLHLRRKKETLAPVLDKDADFRFLKQVSGDISSGESESEH